MKEKLFLFWPIVGWAGWAIFNKFATQKLHIFHIQLVGACVGLTLIPVYLKLLGLYSKDSLPQLTFSGIACAVLASLCAVSAAIAFLFRLKTNDAGSTSVLYSTYPLLTMLISVAFLGEKLTLIKAAGTILIVLGATLIF